MSHPHDEVVVPFATFLEVRERRSRVSAAFRQPALSPFSDDSPPTVAVAVALAREAGSAVARSGFHDEATTACWTPPESPNRGSH